MCSQRKLLANRANALKSTGPRTEEGKAASSRNATTHGLTAKSPVVLDEDPAEFEAFARAIRDDLRPHGAFEQVLVDRIVHLSWKLRRVPHTEAEAFALVVPEVESELRRRAFADPVAPVTASRALAHDLASGISTMARVQMYELRIERSLHAAMRQLAQYRKMKNEANSEEPREAQPVAEPADAAADEAESGNDGAGAHGSGASSGANPASAPRFTAHSAPAQTRGSAGAGGCAVPRALRDSRAGA